MRQQHVKMAFVHRNIGGLTDGAARMVKPFGHVAQFHKLFEIVHRRIAATADTVADKRRTIDRRQNEVITADFYGAFWVAGMLGEFRGGGFAQLARQSFRQANPFALNIGTGLFPAFQCLRIVHKVNADFL